ncbi:hypothetical protein [Paenibacillus tyrfis]|nr:hypothetical protein [Paenibacillus tyrfis]
MEELFPEASPVEIKRTKAYLEQYKEKKQKVAFFERNPPETDKQKSRQAVLIKFTSLVERAVGEILQSDVKAVIEYRFIKGNSRAATIIKFSGWDYCDKTIDRKITEGITSVANTLLYLE